MLLATLLPTSKGASGVTSADFITLVVARWEGTLDRERLRVELTAAAV